MNEPMQFDAYLTALGSGYSANEAMQDAVNSALANGFADRDEIHHCGMNVFQDEDGWKAKLSYRRRVAAHLLEQAVAQ